MNKNTLLLMSMTVLVGFSQMHAEKPKSAAGKIGAGLVQLVNRHAYLFSLPVAPIIFHALKNDLRPEAATVAGVIGWLIFGSISKTATHIILDSIDVAPIK